jgi:DnaJ-domain-containing protein 1
LISAVSGSRASNPTIQALQRKALYELCDWIGLKIVPNQLLPVLDAIGDPGQTLERVIAAVGCDPELIRRKDPVQIANLEIAFDLLIAIDVAGPRLNQQTLDRLRSMAFSGQFAEIKTLSRTISCLASILIGQSRTATLLQFAAYKAFLQKIESFIAYPFAVSVDDASEALALSDMFVDAIEKYSDLRARIVEVGIGIDRVQKQVSGGALLKQFQELMFEADTVHASLANDANIAADAYEKILRDCARLLEGLEGILEAAQERASENHSRRAETNVEMALRYFGFEPNARPSKDEIKKQWRALVRAHHPDHAKDEADRVRRTKKTQEANAAKDVLLAAF